MSGSPDPLRCPRKVMVMRFRMGQVSLPARIVPIFCTVHHTDNSCPDLNSQRTQGDVGEDVAGAGWDRADLDAARATGTRYRDKHSHTLPSDKLRTASP